MTTMPGKTSVSVRPEQAKALASVQRTIAAAEDRRVTLYDVIDRLLALWKSGPGSTTSGARP
jgi:hypothetical protein